MTILNCRKTRGQQVLPLFYDVEPSELRNQTNIVGEAFAKLEEKSKDDEMKVEGWKAAIRDVANLSGKAFGNRNEPEFIQEIIEWVNLILVKKTYFQVAQYPVGIESRVQDVKSLLDIEKNYSTCMVGIFGIGGIGKTTIAKAIYNSIAYEFDGSCFLGDIRETSGQIGGLICLRNELLSKILEDSSIKVYNVDQGITLIKQRLHRLKVLIVLDDVDHSNQLEHIVGKGDWFGLGSRIIITTRDKHLLTKHQVLTYEAQELGHYEALRLFSWHAFNKDKPDDDYVEITKDAISYTRGLPLALTVLGSALKGEDIEYVTKMIVSTRGTHSYSGIEELKDKCLINESYYNSLVMHDLLQEMGKEIVRQESPEEPGKRSRLWFHEDVRHVLEENTGTSKVDGILIDLPKPDMIHLSPKAFKKMKRLRMFINRNAHFSEEPNFLSNELRLLDWPKYPGESLPSNFRGKNLVVLIMPQSHLKELEGVQNFQNITIMNFSRCEFLRKIPDVSRIPNLEKLALDGCKNLVEVHHSVGFLDKLISLSLCECSKLMSFPKSLKMRSLENLWLPGCSKLKNFPEIECQMECLKEIDFSETGIEELPSSIAYLVGVKTLNLNGCTNLMNLPDSVRKLQHLEKLSMQDLNKIILPCLGGQTNFMNLPHSCCLCLDVCSKVVEFLETLEDTRQSMPNVPSVEESAISSMAELLQLSPPMNTSDSADACSSIVFPKLQQAFLSESILFWTFGCYSTLTELDLSRSYIVALPPCIRGFVRLKFLFLMECKQLREILGLPPNLIFMSANRCVSLAIFLEEGRRFPNLILGNHVPLESDLLIQHDCPSRFELLDLSGSAIVSLPVWLNKFAGLKRLVASNLEKFQNFHQDLNGLTSLIALDCKKIWGSICKFVY
ncbi:TMV resistance protein N-like [Corylus avellana]|uniref:TMV resistance protein N-like n=1 Tax=Corylus avellana TaxID=13451 RepID=UPI00286A863D|nr:TMV resistance protein N-like [Corylus avellana]